MCGIVGYIGQKEAVPFLISGLSRLEYRGYDSAGIAVLHDGEIKVAKKKGKLACLEEFIDSGSVNVTALSASATPDGRRTASRRTLTRTPMFPRAAFLRSFTTGSSKTILN